MAGQVKHKQIFSSIKPDWRLAKLLLALIPQHRFLIGAVGKVLSDEGITLMSSTALLGAHARQRGRADAARPKRYERRTSPMDGRRSPLGGFDIGQTVVIARRRGIAVEAMEGTDAAIVRAGELMKSASLGQELRL